MPHKRRRIQNDEPLRHAPTPAEEAAVDWVSVRAVLQWLASKVRVCAAMPWRRANDVGAGAACAVYGLLDADRRPLRLPSGALAVAKQSVMDEQHLYAVVPRTGPGAKLDGVSEVLQAGCIRSAGLRLHDAAGDAHAQLDKEPSRESRVSKVSWLVLPTAPSFLQLPQFWCQTAVSALIDEFVAPVCGHFIAGGDVLLVDAPKASKTKAPSKTPSKAKGKPEKRASPLGVALMECVDGTLSDVLHLLTAEQMQAVVFQFLVAVHAAQSRIQLKHHDSHDKNVFLVLLDGAWVGRAPTHLKRPPSLAATWDGIKLADTTQFGYTLRRPDGSLAHFAVPHHGLLVKMADYDHSAAAHPAYPTLRVMRADWCLMPVQDEKTWGEWGGLLEGAHGYDAQYLVGYMLNNERPRLTKGALAWLSKVQARLGGPLAITLEHGRPAKGRVSDVRPLELLLDETLFPFARPSAPVPQLYAE